MKTYKCENCGNRSRCVIIVDDIEDEDVNEMIKCKYLSNFKELT